MILPIKDTYISIQNELQEMLYNAENLLNTYTCNNKEQEYKHNNYNIISELNKLYAYYFNQSLNYENTLKLFITHCANCLIIADKSSYGNRETYYDVLHSLTYYDNCRRIMHENKYVYNILVENNILKY